jgi:hypothetical protein
MKILTHYHSRGFGYAKTLALKFLLSFLTATVLLSPTTTAATKVSALPPGKQIYQLMIYHLKDKSQETRIDQYLKDAWLPAAHRAGLKAVGVFKTRGIDTAADKKIYLLISYRTLAEYQKKTAQISADKELMVKGSDYINAAYDNPPYTRKEVIMMVAFSGMPMLKKPVFTSSRADRIYELRSYEGATEKLYANKVSMFNDGNEMEIFDRIGSQPVFYGEVIAGSKMPNLMYMTSYSDLKSRDEHWKAFGNDPAWKKLSAMPQYQHNVSTLNLYYLVPTEYSDY